MGIFQAEDCRGKPETCGFESTDDATANGAYFGATEAITVGISDLKPRPTDRSS